MTSKRIFLGRMTKTIRPISVGETRDDPTRSMLCLKAWIIWRARNAAGWVGACTARKRAIEDLEIQVYIELRGLQPQSDGVLGNKWATEHLQTWVPDVVAKLRSAPSDTVAAVASAG